MSNNTTAITYISNMAEVGGGGGYLLLKDAMD